MVKRTKAETERFYRGLLAEHAESGVTLREFAAKRGIPAGTLSCWRHQLKTRDAERTGSKKSAAPRFVAVNVVGAPREAPRRETRSGVYEIVLGRDRVVRLPTDFDEARVAALMKAVASC